MKSNGDTRKPGIDQSAQFFREDAAKFRDIAKSIKLQAE